MSRCFDRIVLDWVPLAVSKGNEKPVGTFKPTRRKRCLLPRLQSAVLNLERQEISIDVYVEWVVADPDHMNPSFDVSSCDGRSRGADQDLEGSADGIRDGAGAGL